MDLYFNRSAINNSPCSPEGESQDAKSKKKFLSYFKTSFKKSWGNTRSKNQDTQSRNKNFSYFAKLFKKSWGNTKENEQNAIYKKNILDRSLTNSTDGNNKESGIKGNTDLSFLNIPWSLQGECLGWQEFLCENNIDVVDGVDNPTTQALKWPLDKLKIAADHQWSVFKCKKGLRDPNYPSAQDRISKLISSNKEVFSVEKTSDRLYFPLPEIQLSREISCRSLMSSGAIERAVMEEEEMRKKLLDQEASNIPLDAEKNAATHSAAKEEEIQAEPHKLPDEFLLKNNSINLKKNIINAVNNGDIEEIKKWICENVDLNISLDEKGNTAAHLAVQSGKILVLNILCKYGAINTCNLQGKTPLDLAIDKNYIRSEKALLKNNAVSLKQLVAKAAIEGKTAAIRQLHAKNIDLNISLDEEGNTAAHLAVEHGKTGVLLFLCKINAINVCNLEYKTPLDLARDKKRALAESTLLKNSAVSLGEITDECIKASPEENFKKIEKLMKREVIFNIDITYSSIDIYFKMLDFAISHEDDKAIQALLKISTKVLNLEPDASRNMQNLERTVNSLEEWGQQTITLLRPALASYNYEAIQLIIKIAAKELHVLSEGQEVFPESASSSAAWRQKIFMKHYPFSSSSRSQPQPQPQSKPSQPFDPFFKNRESEEIFFKDKKSTKIFSDNLKYLSDIIRDFNINKEDRVNKMQEIIERCARALNVPGNTISKDLKGITGETEAPINRYKKTLPLLHLAIRKKNKQAIPLLMEMCKYDLNAEDEDYLTRKSTDTEWRVPREPVRS